MFHRTAVMLTAAAFTAMLGLTAAEPAAPAAGEKVYFSTIFARLIRENFRPSFGTVKTSVPSGRRKNMAPLKEACRKVAAMSRVI